MFDLENSIVDWRDSLRCNDAMMPESVTELEEHLRESIDSLRGSELNDQELFVIATMRLGTADALTGEYGKVNEGLVWRKRLAWMTGGYLGGVIIGALIGGIASLVSAATAFVGFPGAASGVVAVVVAAACWGGLIYYLMSRQHRWRTSWNPIALVCILILAMLVGHAMNIGGQLIQNNFISASQFGVAMMWRAYGSFGIYIAVFIACLSMIFRPREKPRCGKRLAHRIAMMIWGSQLGDVIQLANATEFASGETLSQWHLF